MHTRTRGIPSSYVIFAPRFQFTCADGVDRLRTCRDAPCHEPPIDKVDARVDKVFLIREKRRSLRVTSHPTWLRPSIQTSSADASCPDLFPSLTRSSWVSNLNLDFDVIKQKIIKIFVQLRSLCVLAKWPNFGQIPSKTDGLQRAVSLTVLSNSRSNIKNIPVNVSMNHQPVDEVSHFKYLGLYLDRHLNFEIHAKLLIR